MTAARIPSTEEIEEWERKRIAAEKTISITKLSRAHPTLAESLYMSDPAFIANLDDRSTALIHGHRFRAVAPVKETNGRA